MDGYREQQYDLITAPWFMIPWPKITPKIIISEGFGFYDN